MKKYILFTIVSIFTIIGCGGNGSGDDSSSNNEGGIVISAKKSAPNTNINFSKQGDILLSAEYLNSPFSKIEALGLGTTPEIRALSFSDDGDFSQMWEITERGSWLRGDDLEKGKYFVTEEQPVVFDIVNRMYNVHREILVGDDSYEKTEIDINSVNEFKADYLLIGFTKVSVYGKDNDGNNIYAPNKMFFTGGLYTKQGYIPSDYVIPPSGMNGIPDYIHGLVPDEFSTYQLHSDPLPDFKEVLRTYSDFCFVIFSSKTSVPMLVRTGQRDTSRQPDNYYNSTTYYTNSTYTPTAKEINDVGCNLTILTNAYVVQAGIVYMILPMSMISPSGDNAITFNVAQLSSDIQEFESMPTFIDITFDMTKSIRKFDANTNEIYLYDEVASDNINLPFDMQINFAEDYIVR